jgi:hypothetical protein
VHSESGSADHFPTVDPLAAGYPAQPNVTFEFLRGPRSQAHWSIDRQLTLMGTTSCCKIRFCNPHVSGVHASLVCTREGVWVVDLLSSTGTFLNGRKIRLARLDDGDELRIGDSAMRVRCRPTTEAALISATPNVAAETAHLTKLDRDAGPTGLPLEFAPQNPVGFVDPAARLMLESILLPMVQQQLCVVQDQMLDRFQQAIGLMLQMFGTMQKEQLETIRAEMDRVQGLTREIQALQLDLKASVANQSATSTPSAPLAKEDELFQAPSGEVGAAEDKAACQDRQIPNPTDSVVASDTRVSGADIHAALCERMAALQQDRRSRIQKVLDFLSGT